MSKMTFASALARLAELAEQDKLTRFEVGDIAADQVPVGDGNARNGSEAKLVQMADAAGLTLDQLKERRLVAHHTPLSARADSVSWSVYREIVNYTASDQEERQRLFDLVAQPHPTNQRGRWTVTSLRVEMGRPPIQHVASEPLAQRVKLAPVEEQADTLETLIRDPDVQRVVQAREETRAQERAAVRKDVLKTDSIARKLDAMQARNLMEGLMDRFVRDMGEVLPRVEPIPEVQSDLWATAYFLKGRLENIRTICDQVEALMRTGSVGGDVDAFFAQVLSDSRNGGAGA